MFNTKFTDIETVLQNKAYDTQFLSLDCQQAIPKEVMGRFNNVRRLKLRNYSGDFEIHFDTDRLVYLDISADSDNWLERNEKMPESLPAAILVCKSLEAINLNYMVLPPKTSPTKAEQKDFNRRFKLLVDDLEKIVSLKSLSMTYTEIISLKELTRLKSLETLILSSAYALENLEGLDLFPNLKELDLDSTSYIKWSWDTIKIFEKCQKLQVFRSDDRIESMFLQTRDRSNMDAIVENLSYLDDVKQFGKAVKALCKCVKKYNSKTASPLYYIFKLSDEYKKGGTDCDVFDDNLEKYVRKLDSNTLLSLFDASFRNCLDNFRFTIICLDEIVRRRNAGMEKKVIGIYVKASECDGDFDPNNYRTIDIVKRDYFPRFTAGALLKLLGNFELMDYEYEMSNESLFPVALRLAKSDSEMVDKITKLLVKYYKARKDCIHQSLMGELLTDIDNQCTRKTWKKVVAAFSKINVDVDEFL